MLDISVCKKITELVEQLSTSGKDVVDKKVFRELAANAGKSEGYLKFTMEKLLHQLERKHSEIRFGAFLIIDLLFSKSEYFRELLLDEFHVFLELTVESNQDKLLPPPVSAAKKLKQKVLQSIHKWYSSFKDSHKRLTLSYNFLKHNLKVDFNDALKRNTFELQQDLVERQRQSKVIDKKVDAVKEEMEEKVDEISRIVMEMNNCLGLLIPKPDELFQNDNNDSEREDESVDLREHGIADRRAVITIQLPERPETIIRVTEDNAAIVDSLKDHYAELRNGYMPSIKKWVQVVSKKTDDQQLFRKIMDIKSLVEEEMSRFEKLQLDHSTTTTASDSDEESDSDFEEVQDKEGFEDFVVVPPVPAPPEVSGKSSNCVGKNEASWRPWGEAENDVHDPTSFTATMRKLLPKVMDSTDAANSKLEPRNSRNVENIHIIDDGEVPGTSSETTKSRKQKLLEIAPKLPYDVDLYHWEDEKLVAPSVEIIETDGHKFWTPSQDRSGEVIENPDGVASLRTRVIEFSGKFQPVKWSCRAVLPSGRLCPRRDRYKCPLHGKIVARDDLGNPIKPEDIAELEAEKAKAEQDKPPDWQDPEFLKDIEAQTGMDLTIRPPKRRKKKKTFAEMYPGLTDIEKRRNTPRSRLEKKVLNKNSLKRVAATMDSFSHKRSNDKFGDQWNYFMNNE